MTEKEVQRMVNEGLEANAEIIGLDINSKVVHVKYMKGEYIEYAVLRYNDRGVYGGRYFSTFDKNEEETFNQSFSIYRAIVFDV